MTSMGASPAARTENGNPVARAWAWFVLWHRTRPFWAGLLTLLSAFELWSIPFWNTVLTSGTLNLKLGGVAGVSTIMITPIMAVMGVSMWVAPNYRVFAGIFTILGAILSLPVSNFGGFGVGMLLGIIGGGLAFAWAPRMTPEQIAAQERAVAAYANALSDAPPASATSPLAYFTAPAVDEATDVETGAEATQILSDAPTAESTSTTAPLAGHPLTVHPLADTLKPQRTAAESEATVAAPAQPPQHDAVPALPSADDTPLGA